MAEAGVARTARDKRATALCAEDGAEDGAEDAVGHFILTTISTPDSASASAFLGWMSL